MSAILEREDAGTTVAETLNRDVDEITDDTHFIKDLGVDSLTAVQVMVTLEKKCKFKLQESKLREATCLTAPTLCSANDWRAEA